VDASAGPPVADEGEAMLAARGADHLAGDRLKMALLLPVSYGHGRRQAQSRRDQPAAS
jgi:hypothetical protein